MSASATPNSTNVPWWKEPTKDQWYAYIAAWLGWTLDAFDFTIFLLIMVPIAKEFDVPITAVAIVFTLTLWLRLVGATAAGNEAEGRAVDEPVEPLQIGRLIECHVMVHGNAALIEPSRCSRDGRARLVQQDQALAVCR